MFSVSPAEILTIAVVALLVFGPKRLPEIARKAGKVLRDIRSAADELKAGLEAKYADTLEPIKDIRDTMKDAITGVDRQVSGLGDALHPLKDVTDTMRDAITGVQRDAAQSPKPPRTAPAVDETAAPEQAMPPADSGDDEA
ncbi:MAG: twin-arginine translocase TatA/TatE family subunit [Acidimicrobiia bacterium]|nr:twin-arginine translocase TatA/TatE family subunit [Acidimicrobiia bacterium]